MHEVEEKLIVQVKVLETIVRRTSVKYNMLLTIRYFFGFSQDPENEGL